MDGLEDYGYVYYWNPTVFRGIFSFPRVFRERVGKDKFPMTSRKL
jgi:hypothetical protein